MNYFTATLSPRYRIIITSRLSTYLIVGLYELRLNIAIIGYER